MYNIVLSSQVQKFFKNINPKIRDNIILKIENLSENPFPYGCKRIVNRKEKLFRIRIGDFRVLYMVNDDLTEIFISKIDKRSKVYNFLK